MQTWQTVVAAFAVAVVFVVVVAVVFVVVLAVVFDAVDVDSWHYQYALGKSESLFCPYFLVYLCF